MRVNRAGGGRGSVAALALAAVAALAAGCGVSRPPAPRGLVFVTLDTVRYDHLDVYGYPRDTSPTLAELAARSAVFSRAFAQQTNTCPSHASMFTGLYPPSHGLEVNAVALAGDRLTLAQVLRRHGFRTAAFVSGVPMVDEWCGLGRGFEIYRDDIKGTRNPGRIATGRAVAWLRSLRPGEPFFLFLHLYDAHGPYVAPATYRHLFHAADPGPVLARIPRYQQLVHDGRPLTHLNDYVDRYDDLIRYEDNMVWRVLQEIDRERTIVVVLADHGETLAERYQALDHGAQLFDEQLHIPLLLAVPGVPPRAVGALVETVDLVPTLLELLRIPAPRELRPEGRSLVPYLRGAAPPERQLVFASGRAESSWFADRGYRLDEKRPLSTVRGRRFKLIRYPGLEHDYEELYDLASDPGETRDVAAAHPGVRAGLARELDRWLAGSAAGRGTMSHPALTPEAQEELRALGYVH